MIVSSLSMEGDFFLNAFDLGTGSVNWQTKCERQNGGGNTPQHHAAVLGNTVLGVGEEFALFFDATTGARMTVPDVALGGGLFCIALTLRLIPHTYTHTSGLLSQILTVGSTFFIMSSNVYGYDETGKEAFPMVTFSSNGATSINYAADEHVFYVGTNAADGGSLYKISATGKSTLLTSGLSTSSADYVVGTTLVSSSQALVATASCLFLIDRSSGAVIWATAFGTTLSIASYAGGVAWVGGDFFTSLKGYRV